MLLLCGTEFNLKKKCDAHSSASISDIPLVIDLARVTRTAPQASQQVVGPDIAHSCARHTFCCTTHETHIATNRGTMSGPTTFCDACGAVRVTLAKSITKGIALMLAELCASHFFLRLNSVPQSNSIFASNQRACLVNDLL